MLIFTVLFAVIISQLNNLILMREPVKIYQVMDLLQKDHNYASK